MNILITGVSGFIGSGLWNYLKAQKSSLRIFGTDRKLKSSSPFLFSCDLNSKSQFRRILDKVKPDIIFHLTGGRPVNGDLLWQVNLIPTQTLFAAVKELKSIHPRIVIPGSAAEYGKVKAPQKRIAETVEPRPAALYGFVKYMQTSLGLMYAHQGLDVRIARIFNIGGYGAPPSLALGNFAEKIVRIENGGRPFLRVGNLSGHRDFVDIEDVCAALWAVAKKGKRGEVYNVCSGKSSSIRLLLHRMISYSHVKNITVKEEQKAQSSSFDTAGSNAKIKRTTGWCPHVSLEQSLRNTLQYYREKS